jgi:hypothetical protein
MRGSPSQYSNSSPAAKKSVAAEAIKKVIVSDPSSVPPPLKYDDDTASETEPLVPGSKAQKQEVNIAASAAAEMVDNMLKPQVCGKVLMTIFLPWVVFVFAVMMFMHAHHPDPYVRAIAGLALAGVFVFGFILQRRQRRFNESILLALCAFSVIMGALAGGLCYCSGAIDYWAFDEHWQYTNVWPTELAAAHQDASALVFAKGSAPDVQKGTGYKFGGHTYCVAPITMGVSNLGVPDIQYWAAGRDCCKGDGRFTCDDAGEEGARAGLVLYNRTFEFYSTFLTREVDYYAEAARRAKVKFHIVSTTDQPMFVRWVRDLDASRVDFWRRSMVLALEIILGYLPVSILLGLLTPALQVKSLQR